MNRRSLVRAAVVGAGAAVAVEGLLEMRLADWPIYVTFLAVYAIVYLPAVDVMPGLQLPIPNMAVAIGFVYLGGLPILPLRIVSPAVAWRVAGLLPEGLRLRLIPRVRNTATLRGWDVWGLHKGGMSWAVAAEWGIFSIGMAVRWWAGVWVAGGSPAANPLAITVGELAGYTAWGLLALLPIYPDCPLVPRSRENQSQSAALSDVGLVVALALTPFVFLITYGYQADGLPGAAFWAVATLGLHFMLKHLNERRLVVEEQNRQLAVLNRELEHRERLSAIGKMSSVVSHQILQQLGVIGVHADLIRRGEESTDAQETVTAARRSAEAIEGALRDVNRVLTDLLVFSKDLRLNPYEHRMKSVLEEALEDCRPAACASGIALELDCPEDLSIVLDKLKIKQALTNVVRNAIEASSRGGEIRVAAGVHDGNAEIRVSDEGPGIASTDREAVFAPFFTTKDRGTGLGLAIARQFTEAHGGTLTLAADGAGSGATFLFQLPFEPVAPSREVASTPPGESS